MVPTADIRSAIAAATKAAMRARARERLKALRLINAAIKQVEVDTRRTLDDAELVKLLAKQRKQRQDALEQFEAAGRDDLAAIERAELAVIEEFMPQPASASDIAAAIAAAIAATGAAGPRDMGRVMGVLGTQLAGRADMKAVSGQVREALAANSP